MTNPNEQQQRPRPGKKPFATDEQVARAIDPSLNLMTDRRQGHVKRVLEVAGIVLFLLALFFGTSIVKPETVVKPYKSGFETVELRLREALSQIPESESDARPFLAEIYEALGHACYFQHKFSEANQYYLCAGELYETLNGSRSEGKAKSLWNVAHTLWVQGDRKAAESALQQAAALYRTQQGEMGLHMLQACLHRQARLCAEQGNWESALTAAKEVVQLQIDEYGEEHPLTLQGKLVVSDCLIELKRFEKAESLLLNTYALVAGQATPDALLVSEALKSLVDLYTGWDREEEADRYDHLLTASLEQGSRSQS
ncbi:MAG: tetratricopeptide repeat protein [Planctomycetota bacterium]